MLKFTQYSCDSNCPEPYNETEVLFKPCEINKDSPRIYYRLDITSIKRPLLQSHELTHAQIGAGLSWRQKQMLVSFSVRNGCRRNP